MVQAAAAQRKEQLSFMQWLTDDSETPREERVFRMWINSLLPREHQLGSLFGEGMRDGYAALLLVSQSDACLHITRQCLTTAW